MKELLKFITCGSVDDGKSTLIGHILYDAKLLFADQEKALLLDSKVGSRGGEIDYSLLLDGLTAEREQGITIDVAYRYFSTEKRSFIVADTPGHEEYTRNMAVGASFADLAIILVDASKGVLVQTRRHSRICSLMGIRQFVFAVNKMDLVSYNEEVFRRISDEIAVLSKELNLENVMVIPVSATAGDNVTEKSGNMPWYGGDTVLSYIENVDIRCEDEKGFYMPVQRVCRPDYTFRGFQGQIEAGSISVKDEITVLPSGQNAIIKQILAGDKDVETASVGQPVTVTLDREIDVSRGCVIVKGTDIGVSCSFNATLLWMDDSVLREGGEYIVKLGTKKIAGKVKKILHKIDVNTGEHTAASEITKNDIVFAEILLDEEIPVDLFRNHKTLGELILIDRVSNMTSACGVVEEIIDADERGIVIEGNGIKVKTLLFDEYFYNEKSAGIDNYSGGNKRFFIGDSMPLHGMSYNYPANFDILALDSGAAISVRNGRVSDIVPISVYKYTGLPVINDKGFAIGIDSGEAAERFFSDLAELERQVVYEKWMRFETYRRIIFTGNFWGI